MENCYNRIFKMSIFEAIEQNRFAFVNDNSLTSCMKPDFSDYIIAVLFHLEDGLPHSMDECATDILDKCDIEYDLAYMEHFLHREDAYYTSVKATIVMLEANGIVSIDDNHNVMLTRKGNKYIERNDLEISERWKVLYDRKKMKDRQKDEGFW